MSKLTFESEITPRLVMLREAEGALRKNAHWGRLYVEGWPASMQVLARAFRGTFACRQVASRRCRAGPLFGFE